MLTPVCLRLSIISLSQTLLLANILRDPFTSALMYLPSLVLYNPLLTLTPLKVCSLLSLRLGISSESKNEALDV